MGKEEAQNLLTRYVNGTCTPTEKVVVERWYQEQSANHTWPDQHADVDEAKILIWAAIQQRTGTQATEKKVRFLRWHLPAAAALFIFLSVGIYSSYNNHRSNLPEDGIKSSVDLAPGGNKATLTLANGKTIVLDETKNGLLANEGNTAIQKSTNGQLMYSVISEHASTAPIILNTLTTPRGGEYRLQLPDGTNVWLNAASSLTYPTAFSGNERAVELTGEAYFEVTENKELPFRIHSGVQTVEVLGTHFNINAYANEPAIRTTLVAGRVSITQKGNQQPQLLKPGQQAVVMHDGIHVNEVDTVDAVAWKNGLFRFKKADIKTIARQLERWYDVDVIFEGTPPTRSFSGTIHRHVKASEVLDILSYSNIHFRIENLDNTSAKKIIITK